MPRQSMPVKEAALIAQKIADELQVELVDVELVKEPTGHFLRFYIDKPDGIALNELENFHRRIQPLVERVEYDYMEVSSPGADRPLKTERDFERAEGMTVELKTYKPVKGAKQFTGDLVGLRDGMQIEKRILSVDEKLEMIHRLERAGVRVIEVGSFMHPRAVPQMANTDEVFRHLEQLLDFR